MSKNLLPSIAVAVFVDGTVGGTPVGDTDGTLVGVVGEGLEVTTTLGEGEGLAVGVRLIALDAVVLVEGVTLALGATLF